MYPPVGPPGFGCSILAHPGAQVEPLKLDAGGGDVVGLALKGDDLFATRGGTKEKKYRDGAVVRLSLTSRNPTPVAAEQWEPREIVATSHGVVWLNQRIDDETFRANAEVMALAF